jgi:hypothetical protein
MKLPVRIPTNFQLTKELHQLAARKSSHVPRVNQESVAYNLGLAITAGLGCPNSQRGLRSKKTYCNLKSSLNREPLMITFLASFSKIDQRKSCYISTLTPRILAALCPF